MKIKLVSILNFTNLYEKIKTNTSLSIKTKLQLNKLFIETAPHVDFYKNELNLLIEKYAARDEQNQIIQNETGITINPESINDFSTRMIELQDTEIEISDYSFQIEEFEGASSDISATDLMALMPFIKD